MYINSFVCIHNKYFENSKKIHSSLVTMQWRNLCIICLGQPRVKCSTKRFIYPSMHSFLLSEYCISFNAIFSNSTITTFFSPITPTNATSKSRDTQMGSRLGRNTRATINRAIVICRARRLQSHGPLPLHPCHR